MTYLRHSFTSAAVAAALLASLSLPSQAQDTATAPAAVPATALTSPMSPEHRAQHHREKRVDHAAHKQKRLDRLKTELQLSAQQQDAWTQYLAALQTDKAATRMDRQAFAKLTTPQRVDAVNERHAQRAAQLKQRGDATKAFYAQLNAQQQQSFDKASLHMLHGKHARQHGHPGHKNQRAVPATPAQ